MSRLALTLAIASTASLAQNSVSDIPFIPLEANCPVDTHATLEKSGNMLGAQRLQVTLSKWPAFGIVAARVTVHGAPVSNHPEPSEITANLNLNPIVDHPRPSVSSTTNVPHTSTENDMPWLTSIGGPVMVRIVRGHSPDTRTRWYAWVMGFTAVSSIDLDSVSYEDGTSWHAADGKPCRVPLSSSVW